MMRLKRIFCKASVAVVVGICGLLIEAIPVVQAQTRASAGSPTIEEPRVASTERIVLHGLRFRARGGKLDRRSVAILDYALQIIKQNPKSLICLSVRCVRGKSQGCTDSKLIERRTRTVASYFEQRGISANRLVVLESGSAPYFPANSADQIQTSRGRIEIVQLDLTNEVS